MKSIKTSLVFFILFAFFQLVRPQDSDKSHYDDDLQSIKKKGYSTDACMRMAEDFLRTGTEQIKAIPYLEYVLSKDRDSRPNALHMLSQAYYYCGKFDKAVELLTEYIGKEKDKHLVRDAKSELEQYKNAQKIASCPLNAELINLGPEINGPYAEINPYVSQNENLMVYSSNRSKSYNIYVSKKEGIETNWAKSKLAGAYINSVNDEFVAGLSSTGKNLFVHYNQSSNFEDINMSIRERGLYRELNDPGTKINSLYREEGVCTTEEGDTMYFSSDRPGGYGGLDIYYSLKLPDGSYGTAINLGENVNTKFDENYPNLSPNGNKLYFASKGHNSIGGYDIFYTTRDPNSNEWARPVNLGYPINNAFDNKSITFTNDPRYAYISTIDLNTLGDYDIYKVVFLDLDPEYLIVKTQVNFLEDGKLVPFSSSDNHLEITLFKDQDVYGKYALDKRNNSFVMALSPGSYIIELVCTNFKPYRKKVNIQENYYKNNLRTLKIRLEKNNPVESLSAGENQK